MISSSRASSQVDRACAAGFWVPHHPPRHHAPADELGGLADPEIERSVACNAHLIGMRPVRAPCRSFQSQDGSNQPSNRKVAHALPDEAARWVAR